MLKDYEKLFIGLKPAEPSADLFDRIILAIKQEQELQRSKRLVRSFLILLVASFTAIPFSWTMLVDQVESSGVLYFLSTATSDLSMFFAYWQDFGSAIVESLPITGVTVFIINIIFLIFTLRLFFYKKGILLGYIMHSFKLS